jgi:hypothetical protein
VRRGFLTKVLDFSKTIEANDDERFQFFAIYFKNIPKKQ